MSEQSKNALAGSASSALVLQVGAATLARLFINTSRRFMYPFAPALSRGLGVPLTAITSLIAVNQVTGLLSPFFGPLSDRWGYRAMMLAALGMLVVGMLAGGLFPIYGVVLVGMFLVGLAKSVYDPALQAYAGERVPYERRGLVIGLIELSWAGSSLIGIPLTGLLIERQGWRAPFFWLGALGLLSLIALARLIPSDRRAASQRVGPTKFRQAWQRLRQERSALAALAFGFFVAIANDNMFVVYGAWLEQEFALGLVALGSATTVIGLAELTGETLTATIADRLGLKRAVFIGVLLSTLSYLFLPLLGRTLPLALLGLFLIFLTFEFTIVTSFSLLTALLPEARATMMSSYLAATSLGRVVGALVGGALWLWGGIPAVGFVSAGLSGVGLLFFGWGLWGWQVREGQGLSNGGE